MKYDPIKLLRVEGWNNYYIDLYALELEEEEFYYFLAGLTGKF